MEKQLEWTMHLDDKYYMNVFGKRTPVVFTHGRGIFIERGRQIYRLIGSTIRLAPHQSATMRDASQARSSFFLELLLREKQAGSCGGCARSVLRIVFSRNSGRSQQGAIKLARFISSGRLLKPKIVSLRSCHGRI